MRPDAQLALLGIIFWAVVIIFGAIGIGILIGSYI